MEVNNGHIYIVEPNLLVKLQGNYFHNGPGQPGHYENQYCHNGPVESKYSFVVVTLCNYEIITPSPLGLWV